MLKKSLVIATLATAAAGMTLATKADAADPVLGALIGGGIGAAIGHDANRHHGAAVGGVVGALIGSSIAADSNRYYGPRYYDEPYYGYYDRGYYAPPSYGYYAPAAPVYYSAPYYAPPAFGATIVYNSGPSYRYRDHRHYHRGDRHWR
ncbi:MAG TPA: YMGG-like glycine zipper-containing protein [Usitatibacter sp.]|nr:YMGG-like glycine zipper-containing protein [Usitatibacter sp.]